MELLILRTWNQTTYRFVETRHLHTSQVKPARFRNTRLGLLAESKVFSKDIQGLLRIRVPETSQSAHVLTLWADFICTQLMTFR